MGEKLCVITSSEDVSTIFKSPKQFTFEVFVRDVSLLFGVLPEIVDLMFRVPSEDHLSSVPQASAHLGKHFIDRAHESYKLQLHPGDRLDILQDAFLSKIDGYLQWSEFSDKFTLEGLPNRKTVSLLGWCTEVLLASATKAVFGNAILEIEPNLQQAVFDFDNENWKLNYRVPRILAKKMYAAKQKVFEALLQYFKLPREKRSGGAWLIETLETDMRDMGIDDHQIASTISMTLWVYV